MVLAGERKLTARRLECSPGVLSPRRILDDFEEPVYGQPPDRDAYGSFGDCRRECDDGRAIAREIRSSLSFLTARRD
jgi:hypothetical protein